jgi:hypothetical protein
MVLQLSVLVAATAPSAWVTWCKATLAGESTFKPRFGGTKVRQKFKHLSYQAKPI